VTEEEVATAVIEWGWYYLQLVWYYVFMAYLAVKWGSTTQRIELIGGLLVCLFIAVRGVQTVILGMRTFASVYREHKRRKEWRQG